MARPFRRHRAMVPMCLRGRSEPMTIVTLGIDLGKNLNSIVGLGADGNVVLRRRARRGTLTELAGQLPPCTVAMEACCGAHHVGRLFAAKGHEIRLMSPEYGLPPLRACAKERRQRRRGDRGSCGAADYALRRTEEPGSARSSDPASGPVASRRRPQIAVEPVRGRFCPNGDTPSGKDAKCSNAKWIELLVEPRSPILSVRILALIADMRVEWRSLDHPGSKP